MRFFPTYKLLAPGVWILLTLALFAPVCHAQLQVEDFDVTDGRIEKAAGNRLMVSSKEMRGTVKFRTQQNVTLRFTYLGPTREVARLGSGEIRSQFGIKLRSLNQCNLVYVMWHFAPDQKIAVSIKRNPGQSTHEECLDHGYINNIKPSVSAPAPPVHPDQPHVLNASMQGSNLTVMADNQIVWKGDLGHVALEVDGPVGLRSDNAHVVFDFLAKR